MNYNASYDTATKIITPAVIILVAASMAALFLVHTKEDTGWVLFIVLLTVLLLLVVSAASAPKSYSIDKNHIYINRLLMPPLKIAIADVLSVAPVPKQQLKGSFRLFGAGAFFGYYGTFISKKLGRMKWFATNLHNAVFIKTHGGKKYLLTPDEQNAFIETIQNNIKKAA
ncbi:PH domain-containing protein [Niabella aquatica]